MDQTFMDAHGGVVSTRELRRQGLDEWSIRKLCNRGQLTRLRPGWYSGAAPRSEVTRAVGLGGCLTCVSALRWHGLWTPPSADLHLRRSERFRKAPTGIGVRVCKPPGRFQPVTRAIDPVPMALLSASTCLPGDDLVVLLDSALNKRLLTEEQLVDLLAATPAGHELARLDRAESGTETYVRLRLRRRGIKLRVQVQIGDIGRVDILIGDRLVVEIDSRSHHDSPENYAKDRRRDRKLHALGFRVVRLTYAEVMIEELWAEAEADLLAMTRRGDHRRPRVVRARDGGRVAKQSG